MVVYKTNNIIIDADFGVTFDGKEVVLLELNLTYTIKMNGDLVRHEQYIEFESITPSENIKDFPYTMSNALMLIGFLGFLSDTGYLPNGNSIWKLIEEYYLEEYAIQLEDNQN